MNEQEGNTWMKLQEESERVRERKREQRERKEQSANV